MYIIIIFVCVWCILATALFVSSYLGIFEKMAYKARQGTSNAPNPSEK